MNGFAVILVYPTCLEFFKMFRHRGVIRGTNHIIIQEMLEPKCIVGCTRRIKISFALRFFILQLRYAYEMLELFCLQVIKDWFCIFVFFLILLVGLCVEILNQCDVVNIDCK